MLLITTKVLNNFATVLLQLVIASKTTDSAIALRSENAITPLIRTLITTINYIYNRIQIPQHICMSHIFLSLFLRSKQSIQVLGMVLWIAQGPGMNFETIGVCFEIHIRLKELFRSKFSQSDTRGDSNSLKLRVKVLTM